MSSEGFNFSDYGRLKKGEVSSEILLVQKGSGVEASLRFTSHVSREIHLDLRIWITRVQVFVDGAQSNYVGPLASMPPPEKGDFSTVTGKGTLESEAILLNDYFDLNLKKGTQVRATFQYSGDVNIAESEITFR